MLLAAGGAGTHEPPRLCLIDFEAMPIWGPNPGLAAGPRQVCDLRTRHGLASVQMVGVGSPAQELGQFVTSHLAPDRRRAAERRLVSGYHRELTAALRARGRADVADTYTLDACWAEYVAGGIGRWGLVRALG